MRYLLLLCFGFCQPILLSAQTGNSDVYYNLVFDAKYVQYHPYFPFGADSAVRFYYTHFNAMDTVVASAIRRGDTATYIRIYFSFTIDEDGVLYEPLFQRIASTLSSNTVKAKTLFYFNAMKPALQKAIKNMIQHMPMWHAGIQNGRAVKCNYTDYLQLWLGINPPAQ